MTAVDKMCSVLAQTGIVFYYTAAPKEKGYPYIRYSDLADDFFKADDRIDDVVGEIQVDYFTKDAFDGGKEAITQALDGAKWPFECRHMYERAEKLHHFFWVVRVT